MRYLETHHADAVVKRLYRAHLLGAIWHGFKIFLLFLLLGLLVVGLASTPSQWQRIRFWVEDLHLFERKPMGSELNTRNWISPSRFLHEPMFESVPLVPAVAVEPNSIYIPAINVRAPIGWDVPLDESLNGLQQGVVQAKESYLPGEIGRTFIIGHSSGYLWSNNPWNTVFVLLDKLKPDDVIYVRRDSKLYAYTVTESKVVSPEEVTVVRDESLNYNQLALMTCTPVGTTLNRLIVFADPAQVE